MESVETVVPRRQIPSRDELLKKHRPATVTVNDAADYIGVSVSTLRRYYLNGIIPCIRPGGRRGRVLFRIKSLDEWMDKMEEESYKSIYDLDYGEMLLI